MAVQVYEQPPRAVYLPNCRVANFSVWFRNASRNAVSARGAVGGMPSFNADSLVIHCRSLQFVVRAAVGGDTVSYNLIHRQVCLRNSVSSESCLALVDYIQNGPRHRRYGQSVADNVTCAGGLKQG